MMKNKAELANNLTYIESGNVFAVEDSESGSKAVFPIIADKDARLVRIKLDHGVIDSDATGQKACDYLITDCKAGEAVSLACFVELKGTESSTEVGRAYKQIRETIETLRSYGESITVYMKKDLVCAAVSGAPNKTIPRMLEKNERELCKKLNDMSGRKTIIKNMQRLLFYIQNDKNCKRLYVKNDKIPPFNIVCHKRKDTAIPFPSKLVSLIVD